MNWSVPAAIKWIRALEQFDLQFVEQPVPDFDLAGMAQVRRAVATPIAADESCTSVRSAIELIKADACDVFVVYPVRGGRADARERRSPRSRPRRASGARSAAGPSSASRPRPTRISRRRRRTSPFANDTHYPLQLERRPRRAGRDRGRRHRPYHGEPGLGVTLDPEAVATLSALELRESPFYDDIRGDAPSVGQIL